MTESLCRQDSGNTREWKRYPHYKESGVEWLGEIPEGWGVKPLKYLSKEPLKYGANESAEDEDPHSPRFIRITDINSDGTLKKDTYKSLPETIAQDFLLQDGDILFARSGATVGKTFIYSNSWGRCCFAGYLVRFRSNREQIDPRYLSLYSNSISYWDWISSVNIQSTIQNVSGEKYANHTIPLPPLPEQTAIATFLDRETARIDALIEKKERLITLLEEKRAGLINHAVTKGLDPSVPMKDSGVDWIGMVPAEWNVERIKRVARMESGHTPSRQNEDYWIDCNIPWISLNDTKYLKDHDYISDTFYRISELGMANSSAHLLPAGAVVFTRDATIGLAAITTRPMAVSQHIIAWLCGPNILPEYLLFTFYAMIQDLERLTMGSTIKTIGMSDIFELVTPVPPIDEQDQIVKFVFDQKGMLDKIVAKIQESNRNLQEYRSALISAAVTGKIDLRQEAIG